MGSVRVNPSFFTLDDYLRTLPDQKTPEGIQDTPLMGGEVAGDMSAFKITKVQRSCAANGEYSYSFLSQAALDGKLEGLPTDVQALLKDIAVNTVCEDETAFKALEEKVKLAYACIIVNDYSLRQNGELSTEKLLESFESAELIYREWPSVRKMYEASELKELRKSCFNVFSKIVACRYAKLSSVLISNPETESLRDDMNVAFAANYPANLVLDNNGAADEYVMLKSFIDAEVKKEKYTKDLSLLHNHGITEEQYYSAERKRRMVEKFPVKPVLQNH